MSDAPASRAPSSRAPRKPAWQRLLASPESRCLLAALGAWAITVAPLCTAGKASTVTRAAALCALVPAIAGPLNLARRQRLARHLGLSAFVAVVALAWALASREGALGSIDAFRGALGVVAWGVFAVAWWHPFSLPDADLKQAPEGAASGLRPRRSTPRFAVGVATAGAVAAAFCLALAWRADGRTRAVLAHALAVGAAVALLTASAQVAAIAGREPPTDGQPAPLPIDRKVWSALLLALAIAGAAAALYLSGA